MFISREFVWVFIYLHFFFFTCLLHRHRGQADFPTGFAAVAISLCTNQLASAMDPSGCSLLPFSGRWSKLTRNREEKAVSLQKRGEEQCSRGKGPRCYHPRPWIYVAGEWRPCATSLWKFRLSSPSGAWSTELFHCSEAFLPAAQVIFYSTDH